MEFGKASTGSLKIVSGWRTQALHSWKSCWRGVGSRQVHPANAGGTLGSSQLAHRASCQRCDSPSPDHLVVPPDWQSSTKFQAGIAESPFQLLIMALAPRSPCRISSAPYRVPLHAWTHDAFILSYMNDCLSGQKDLIGTTVNSSGKQHSTDSLVAEVWLPN